MLFGLLFDLMIIKRNKKKLKNKMHFFSFTCGKAKWGEKETLNTKQGFVFPLFMRLTKVVCYHWLISEWKRRRWKSNTQE